MLQQFEIPTTAGRVHATRSDLYRQAKNEKGAETARARAAAIVAALADGLAADDPLRQAFLAAAPVRRCAGFCNPPRRCEPSIDPP